MEPNSTPMVVWCMNWKRLSVNCRRRQDFPTEVFPITITCVCVCVVC